MVDVTMLQEQLPDSLGQIEEPTPLFGSACHYAKEALTAGRGKS